MDFFFFFFFEVGNQISTSFCVLSACQVLWFLKNVCTSQVSVHVVHGLVMKSQCQWSLYQMVFPCKHDESEIMGSICIGLCLCIYPSKKKINWNICPSKKGTSHSSTMILYQITMGSIFHIPILVLDT